MRRALALIGLLGALIVAATAHATFPGANGKIAFVRTGDIWTMNPDGSNQVNVTNDAQTQGSPNWFPDGSKIAFDQRGSGSPNVKVWTMQANGSNRTIADDGSACCVNREQPAWSPDGTRIVFSNGTAVFSMDPDGTRIFGLAGGGVLDPDWSPAGDLIAFEVYDHNCGTYELVAVASDASSGHSLTGRCEPGSLLNASLASWSPDAQEVAYRWEDLSCYPATCAPNGVYRVSVDGSGSQAIRTPAAATNPSWAPDEGRIAFEEDGRIKLMKPDGSDVLDITDGSAPSWQPIPINSYARPKGATPLRVALVTANNQCTAPNRTHGAPLAFGSCAPPQLSSNQLTVGTGDSNARPALMQASLRLDVAGGDVSVQASLNDVFNKDLSDYTGTLRASLPVQITDKNNTPSPGGPGAATTATTPFEFTIGCTPTADTSAGSNCDLNTTLDTIVPGAVTAGKRAVWQLGQVKVYDGSGSLFAVQGVFIP